MEVIDGWRLDLEKEVGLVVDEERGMGCFGLGEANRAVKAPGCHQANTDKISLDEPIRVDFRYTIPRKVGLG